MTASEKVTAELKKGPQTARGLAKRLGIGKVHCFEILHRVGKKAGKVREGKTGPESTVWKLK
jgi:hypothetical protein